MVATAPNVAASGRIYWATAMRRPRLPGDRLGAAFLDTSDWCGHSTALLFGLARIAG